MGQAVIQSAAKAGVDQHHCSCQTPRARRSFVDLAAVQLKSCNPDAGVVHGRTVTGWHSPESDREGRATQREQSCDRSESEGLAQKPGAHHSFKQRSRRFNREFLDGSRWKISRCLPLGSLHESKRNNWGQVRVQARHRLRTLALRSDCSYRSAQLDLLLLPATRRGRPEHAAHQLMPRPVAAAALLTAGAASHAGAVSTWR